MKCSVPSDYLNDRGARLSEMLRLIAGARPVSFERTNVRGSVTLTFYSGPRPTIAPRDWRFNTSSQGIRAAYFERWMPVDENRRFYFLDRSYLHLYRQVSAVDKENEILALHCDPNEPDDSGELHHALYKRGPHIHVDAAPFPLPKSHFALNIANLLAVLESADAVTEAMTAGVQMVRDQVLDVYDSHSS